MEVGVVGISHQNAAIEIREKIAFTTNKKTQAIETLKLCGIDEIVILSTCNRAEIYFISSSAKEAASIIEEYCEEAFGSNISQYLYIYRKNDAISHLFRVACGIESLVLGEDQILGQVKDAISFAMTNGSSGKILNMVFRKSVEFAKRIKTVYRMSENPLSVSSVAVKYISREIGGFGGKNVLLIGMGKIGKLILKYLSEIKDVNIFITKRASYSGHKFMNIENEYTQATTIDFEARYKVIADMDVVFSATASPHIVIDADKLLKLEKNVTFMDMAVPRDIDTRIGEIEKAVCFDLDDLKAIVDENEAYRRQVAQQIREKIDEEAAQVEAWLVRAQVDDTIQRIHKICDDVYQDTWTLIDKKIDLSSKDAENMQKIVRSCIKKVVRTPIEQLKSADNEGDINRLKSAIAYLYDLEEA